MTAEKKAYKRKVAAETANMTEEEKQKYMADEEMAQKFEKLARERHQELFPEAYEMMGDSTSDSKMRQQGKNPMSEEYTAKVNERRKKLGFQPLGDNGLPVDNGATMQYCEDLISKKKR